MNLQEVLNSGDLYQVGKWTDEHYFEYLQQMEEYNAAGYTAEGQAKKAAILRRLFAEVGENAYIQAPYYAMWGGRHVHLGKNVYINFNCTLVDDAEIYIGDGTMIAPNVTIVTASHPLSPDLRAQGYGYNSPVWIGKNVWIASNVTILPGVHIGDNAVIAAGSVVTHDLPAGIFALGTPARMVREIGPEDEVFYRHGMRVEDHLVPAP